MNENEKEVSTGVVGSGRGRYRPRLSYYHANAKGTGSAIQFELHPAHDSELGMVEGSIFVIMANQLTVGRRDGATPVFPSFDWKNRVVLRLTMADVSQLLMVFRGIQENLCDGKGIFHRSARFNTIIKFTHELDPRPGYALEVSRKPVQGGEVQRVFIAFSPTEALGLSLAIEQSLGLIAFGLPEVLVREGQSAQEQPLAMAAGAESLSGGAASEEPLPDDPF